MVKIMYKVVRERVVMFLRHLNLEAQGGSQSSLRKVNILLDTFLLEKTVLCILDTLYV